MPDSIRPRVTRFIVERAAYHEQVAARWRHLLTLLQDGDPVMPREARVISSQGERPPSRSGER